MGLFGKLAFWNVWLNPATKASRVIREENKFMDQLKLLLERELEQEEELRRAFDVVKNEGDLNKRAMKYLAFRNDLNKFEELEETIVAIDEKLTKIMNARLKNMDV